MKLAIAIFGLIALLILVYWLAKPGIEMGCDGTKDFDINCGQAK